MDPTAAANPPTPPNPSPGHADPAPAPGDHDRLLLEAYLRRGDREALGALLARHTALAYGLARRLLHHDADAEDAVQTAFLKVARHAGEYREEASVRSWMLAIVARTCLDLRRGRERRTTHEQAAPALDQAPPAGPDPARTELLSAVRQAVEGLPDKYRAPVYLHYYGGLTSAEVGAVLSVSDSTVRSQLMRGLERLRQVLSRSGLSVGAPALAVLLHSAQAQAVPPALASAVAQVAGAAMLPAGSGLGLGAATAGSGTGALTTAGAVSAGAGLGGKLALAAALLIGAVASPLLLELTQSSRPPSQPLAAAPAPAPAPAPGDPPPAAQPDAPAPGIIHWTENQREAAFQKALDQPIGLPWVGAYLVEIASEVALEHHQDFAIDSPAALDRAFVCSVTDRNTTFRQAMEKIAAAGGLELEYRQQRVVFWKKAQDSVLADLDQALKSDQAQTRAEAICDLAVLADRRVVPRLSAALEDPDPLVLAWALAGLEQHQKVVAHAGAVETLVARLDRLGDQPAHRPKAIMLLGQTRHPAALAALRRIHRNLPFLSTNTLLSAVAQIGTAEAADYLGKPAEDQKLTALSALGRCRHPNAAKALLEAAQRTDPFHAAMAGTIRNALRQHMDQPVVLDYMLKLVHSPDRDAAAAAAPALAASPDPRAVDALLQYAQRVLDSKADPKNTPLAQMPGSLARCRDRRAADLLLKLAQDAASPYQNTATWALGNLNLADPRADQVALKLAAEASPLTRQNLCFRLVRMYDPRATELHLKIALERLAEAQAAGKTPITPNFLGSRPCALAVTDEMVKKWAAESDLPRWVTMADALLLSRDPRVVDHLLEVAARDQDPRQAEAVRRLRNVGFDPRVGRLFCDFLERGGKAFERWTAQLSYPPIFPHLTDPGLNRRVQQQLGKLAASDRVEDRRLAVGVAGPQRHVRAVPALVALMADPDVKVRGWAAVTFSDVPDPRLHVAAVACLISPDTEVSGRARLRFIHGVSAAGVDALLKALPQADSDTRRTIVYVLGGSQDRRIVPQMIALLKDKDRNLAATAARALGAIPGIMADPAAQQAWKQADAGIRFAWFWQLRDAEDAASRAFLLEQLARESSVAVSRRIAQVLSQGSGTKALEELLAAFAQAKDPARAALALALGQTGSPRVIKTLLEYEKQAQGADKVMAIEALGQTRDPLAVEPILAALTTGDSKLGAAAARAIAPFVEPRAARPLLDMVEIGGIEEQHAAVTALERLLASGKDFPDAEQARKVVDRHRARAAPPVSPPRREPDDPPEAPPARPPAPVD